MSYQYPGQGPSDPTNPPTPPYQPQPQQPQQPYQSRQSSQLYAPQSSGPIQLFAMQRPTAPRNDTMKMWAIILFVAGHTLALIAGLTLVLGIGLCILPFALIAEAAGFVCLCLI